MLDISVRKTSGEEDLSAAATTISDVKPADILVVTKLSPTKVQIKETYKV